MSSAADLEEISKNSISLMLINVTRSLRLGEFLLQRAVMQMFGNCIARRYNSERLDAEHADDTERARRIS
jgi:hypothetical protein